MSKNQAAFHKAIANAKRDAKQLRTVMGPSAQMATLQMPTLPPFNPSNGAPKLRAKPGPGDDVPCAKCGAAALDTGLECSECGHDNYEAITGKPFGA